MSADTTMIRADAGPRPIALRGLADYKQLAELLGPMFGGAPMCVLKLLAGASLGFDAYASLTGIHVIEGKTSLGSHLIASAIKKSDKYDYEVVERDGVRQTTDAVCELEFFERVAAQGLLSRKFSAGWKSAGRLRYTIEDARAKGWHLSQTGKEKGPWARTPRNMLFARAVVDGYKTYCPDLYGGALVYDPDELDSAQAADGGTDVIEVAPTGPDAAPVTDPNAQALAAQTQVDRIAELVNSQNIPWEGIIARLQARYGVGSLRLLSASQADEVEQALRGKATLPAGRALTPASTS